MSNLALNYQNIKSKIQTGVGLIAVSKTKPADLIREVYELGQREFGENKVQELLEKSQNLENLSEIKWHFIGHLQSNKINQLLQVNKLVAIHSVDRMSLLDKLIAKKPNRPIDLFLQVNTSGEAEKGGFTEEDQLIEAAKKIQDHPEFQLKGLMTIGKIRTEDFEKDARSCFSTLNTLKQSLDNALSTELELSMGMSNDFEIAQEMGSHWVRVGSSIFGKRD